MSNVNSPAPLSRSFSGDWRFVHSLLLQPLTGWVIPRNDLRPLWTQRRVLLDPQSSARARLSERHALHVRSMTSSRATHAVGAEVHVSCRRASTLRSSISMRAWILLAMRHKATWRGSAQSRIGPLRLWAAVPSSPYLRATTATIIHGRKLARHRPSTGLKLGPPRPSRATLRAGW